MNKIILTLALLLSVAANAQRVGLVFYYQPDQSFIDSFKVKIYDVYGIKHVSVVIKDAKQDEFNADSTVDSKLYKFINKKHNRVLAFSRENIYSISEWGGTIPVYGYSGHLVGILSDYMMEDSNRSVYLMNVGLHEYGHICGLSHCEDPKCLMIPHGHLENTTLCANCKKKLKFLRKYE